MLGTRFGDADLNHIINFEDFVALTNSFGLPGGWANGNFNLDFISNFEDFALLLNNFGSVFINVPEPVSLLPLALGGDWRC